MYHTYNLEEIIDESKKQVLGFDRLLYRQFFETIEKNIINNDMILGGEVGIKLLIDAPLDKDSFYWEIYTINPFEKAKLLADELFNTYSPHIPTDTVSLRTDIRHREFTIMVNGRFICKIYGLQKYRNIPINNIINKSYCHGYFTKELLPLISEEMQLITIYKILYSPSHCAEWRQYSQYESKLYEKVKDTLAVRFIKTVIGAEDKKTKYGFVVDLLLARAKSGVLIGDYAINKICPKVVPERLQFITSENIDIMCSEVNKQLSFEGNYKITSTEYDQFIFDDFRLTKHSIYLLANAKQLLVAEVFCTTTYELIPYHIYDTFKCGTPFVLLRYAFIELWSTKLIYTYKQGTSASLLSRINKIVNDIDAIKSADVPLFQVDNYTGTYISERVMKKKLLKNIGEKFPIYYPVKAKPYPIAVGGQDNYTTNKINFTDDIEIKRQIVYKITKSQPTHDIKSAILDFRSIAMQYSKWGVKKSINRFNKKHAIFLPYIPQTIHTCVDIGCGDGLDLVALKSHYKTSVNICVDISDNRDKQYKESKFVKVILGAPLDIPDASADLVIIFHSLHHMQEDVRYRLTDIARIVKKGGTILLKDHNIVDSKSAAAVDFEHFVYYASQNDVDIDECALNFAQIEPMKYYSMNHINKILLSLGFVNVLLKVMYPLTHVYGAVYKKL